MANWYILNVIAGQEKNVEEEIKALAKTYSVIKDTFIPEKKVVRTIRGKKHDLLQKLFPCYVFINMEMENDARIAIKNLNRALDFLGYEGKPKIVSDAEVETIRRKVEQDDGSAEENAYSIGDSVKITEGSFESFTGIVEAIDLEKKILKVSISIFSRQNDVEIETSKVEKV
ncbi:MAG: transcription termination/antitermination protein NusG [Rickettsiales bacterium]|jgi:transcriptional antiterminator NusG|nr:transcription termination/antitermination protein NusG [Rickettsiales bacterium]